MFHPHGLDIERDDLHREVLRTQGTLTSCFGYDAMGRKSWQSASRLQPPTAVTSTTRPAS